MLSRLGLRGVRLLARLPLPFLRAMGVILGLLLYMLVSPRRRIVHTNLALCFKDLDAKQRTQLARRVFVVYAQTWLDRSWLWSGSESLLSKRLVWQGDTGLLRNADKPVIVFAPHFMGLDAGGTALCRARWRDVTSIYSKQSNSTLDAWIRQGRERFGNLHVVSRSESVRKVVSAMRKHHAALYLLPDMDIAQEGDADTLFVPFFGVRAATTTSLSRFAYLMQAKVVPVVSVLTPSGYDIIALPVWNDFPSHDPYADAQRMNTDLEKIIGLYGVEQYLWLHKRFKTRPQNEPSVY